jgi:hypothetical protein
MLMLHSGRPYGTDSSRQRQENRPADRLIQGWPAFQMTIRSLATMISPLKDFAAPARHSSSNIVEARREVGKH